MDGYKQNTCEELYWETAKRAVAECKHALGGVLRFCKEFRATEEYALEEKYGHLFAPFGEGRVAEKIIDRMVALSIPAYQNDLSAIEDMLDNPYHAELNAHYYLKTGRVIYEDYALPCFDWEAYHHIRELDSREARSIWERHEEDKLAFFLSIAEKLWDFPAFYQKYKEWFTQEEVDAYHAYCKKIFLENHIFLQVEWLLFSAVQWKGKEEFLYRNTSTDFFIRAHKESIEALPKTVFQGKAFKNLLSKKYKIKA